MSFSESGHPDSFGIDRERSGRECNAVRNPTCTVMQTQNPALARKHTRQGQLAELQYSQSERAPKKRGIDQVVEQMIETKPQGGCSCELCVAAADPTLRKENERNDQHRHSGSKVHADGVKTHACDQRHQEETGCKCERHPV